MDACRLAASSLQTDKGAQGSMEREAKYHMLSTLRGLTIVHRLHGLCQGYKAAKSSCFAALGDAGVKAPQACCRSHYTQAVYT